MRNPFRRKHREPEFTGTCLVQEYTGDGHSVGACWYATYDGVCPRHGDVSTYLDYREESPYHWPRDFELPKWDGNKWAEALRAEFRERDRTRL